MSPKYEEIASLLNCIGKTSQPALIKIIDSRTKIPGEHVERRCRSMTRFTKMCGRYGLEQPVHFRHNIYYVSNEGESRDRYERLLPQVKKGLVGYPDVEALVEWGYCFGYPTEFVEIWGARKALAFEKLGKEPSDIYANQIAKGLLDGFEAEKLFFLSFIDCIPDTPRSKIAEEMGKRTREVLTDAVKENVLEKNLVIEQTKRANPLRLYNLTRKGSPKLRVKAREVMRQVDRLVERNF